MNLLLKVHMLIAIYLLVGACAPNKTKFSDLPLSNINRLPNPDVTTRISSLSNCTSKDSDQLNLNSQEPVTVIVHGCFASAGMFRKLADVYAFHGQQTVCFNYDDRERLTSGAAALAKALKELSSVLQQPKIVVIGHSQGGLIARRALIDEPSDSTAVGDIEIDLVTISTPFGGIEAADHCGSTTLAWLSLGLTKPICQLITGRKYRDITANSDFISRPGNLQSSVNRHFKIITDEANTCRVHNNQGTCIEDDFVFSLDEQNQRVVDSQAVTTSQVVKAGHVEIVGDLETVPIKLIGLLQQQGLLRSTPPQSQGELTRLLEDIYISP
ncbi:lipase family alpha/beta hydrolase [Shewanella woodyi]|uniref:AB hydrolase-1 domain-containing protein n=1 Tax=Shewanella woodyi (strain ATCC 51908 / MS32) TaxID=392500 RepID=B1KG77_SHEWM|nr:alpha/beta fold hydrolase [Shewanella woodyi]ACA88214.1 Protein of unknown function DUF676 hydrolase domain protein [Shewanella woodyi ATCC 51908]